MVNDFVVFLKPLLPACGREWKCIDRRQPSLLKDYNQQKLPLL